MPRLSTALPVQSPPGADGQPDLTGRNRLVSNVLFSWAAHSVFIIAGFILPRMIDRQLGQELLGVWDFSWSLVSYFQLVRAAIGSSVNRYVAKYWAVGDVCNINHVVNSAAVVLGLGGLLVMGLTGVVSALLPQWFGERLGAHAHEAQRVVLFLGACLAVQISFSVFNGVLTGCHRWDLHNTNTSGWYAVTVIGMAVSLLLGGQLWTLALIHLIGDIFSAARRVVLAYRVCKGLQLRVSFVRWSTIWKLFSFSGKTIMPTVSNLLLHQTTAVLLLAYLGPAALALYSRPRSLMHHVRTLVSKMAMVLTPTASSLQGKGDLEEIRQLVITSTRYSWYLVLPMILMLVVFGSSILRLWMGPRYADALIPAVLAVGYLPVLVQLPGLDILTGLNAHGRPGIARFIASLVAVGLNILVLRYLKWGLVGTAVAVTLPLAILNVVDIPRVLCRRVGLSVRQYYLSTSIGPVLHLLPFAACLVTARIIFANRPFLGLGAGTMAGGVVLAVVYWRHVLPQSVRGRILHTIHSGRRFACAIIFGR
jgi:O-antigen/teichoic acid export membrane protein